GLVNDLRRDHLSHSRHKRGHEQMLTFPKELPGIEEYRSSDNEQMDSPLQRGWVLQARICDLVGQERQADDGQIRQGAFVEEIEGGKGRQRGQSRRPGETQRIRYLCWMLVCHRPIRILTR